MVHCIDLSVTVIEQAIYQVCLPVSPVCVHKGFDLWWTGCQTKGHQHRYLQTALSPVMTAHHPHPPTAVSDGVPLFVCLLFLIGASSLIQICMPTCAHQRTTANYYSCCCWPYFF